MLSSTLDRPVVDYSVAAGRLRPDCEPADDWSVLEYARQAVESAVPALPSAVDVEAVAHHVAQLLERPWTVPMWHPKPAMWDDVEPSWSLEISAGTVRVRRRDQWILPDVAEPFRTVDDEISLFELEEEIFQQENAGTRGQITGWSRASRARMAEACAQLDMGEWMSEQDSLAMITLTMPGEWLELAPTGAEFKAIMKRFRARWEHALGSMRAVWKLEFQERGAPHLHMLVRVPHSVAGRRIDRWIADQWVGACGTTGEQARRQRNAHAFTTKARPLGCVDIVDQWSDHRRIAAYFNKHAAKTDDGKEYQHDVPEAWQAHGAGPGRFWGYWGLRRAVESVRILERDAFAIRRQLRNVAQGRNAAVQLDKLRHAGVPIGRGRVERLEVGRMDGRQRRECRKLRARRERFEAAGERLAPADSERLARLEGLRRRPTLGGMWVLVNDGLDLAVRLATLYARER